MGIVNELLKDIPLPKMVKVRQVFSRTKVQNIQKEIDEQLVSKHLLQNIKKGQKIAITGGSRGIANLPEIYKEVIKLIKEAGGEPFIIPAMGSHGGATASGQTEILRNNGITEECVGAPIRATMDVVKIGESDNGLPVYIDKYANEADAIVVINRIKPHTSFRGKYESGIMKMIAIGLGKQKGAAICHGQGFGKMAENIPAIARVVLEKKNIAFALGIIENAYDETAKIVALSKDEIERDEPALLKEAASNMAKICFDKFDVLIVDEIGKNISGTGFDTNIVGRYHTPYASGGPDITKMAILSLTPQSHGNANGIGMADFTTRRLLNQMDLEQTYPNSITSTVQISVKIPMILDNDRLAIAAAIRTCNIGDMTKVKLVRIKNTKELDYIYISENLLKEAKQNKNLEIVGELEDFKFNEHENLLF